MTIDRQEIETVFTANLDRLERATIQYGNRLEAMYARNERALRRTTRVIKRQANQLSRDLRRAVAAVAIGVAARQVREYEEAWRNTKNTIQQYSNVLGPALAATSDLNAVANDAGVPMEELGSLTGAAARAAKDLGRSRSDVFAFVETVSKGGALANNGTAALTGAFIQLSQAIASPRVQLQEFNSVVEGTPRLAQAFADGVDGAGGSVAKLRQEIAAGNVSGGELFGGLLSQTEKIREEFLTLDQGPTEAFNRLNNKLVEYIGTNDVAINAAQGLASNINFVADNLDTLTDALVIGAAALTGFFGAQAAAAVISGLTGMTKGVTGLQRAIVLLNAVSKGFGGPLVIGATLLAGALAAVLLQAGRVETVFSRLESASASTADVLERTGRYVDHEKPLAKIGDQAADSIGPVEQLAASIASVTQALNDATVAQFLNDLTALQSQLRESQAILDELEEQSRGAELAADVTVPTFGGGPVTPITLPDTQREALDQARQDVALLEQRLQLAYGSVGDEAAASIRRSLLSGDLKAATEQLRGALVEQFGETTTPTPTATDAEDGEKTIKILDELEKAIRSTFETERQQIERTYQARLEAIDNAKLTQAQADKARLDAELVYRAELAEVAAEEAEATEKQREAEAKRYNEQLQLVAEVEAARDTALGRTLSLIERETEARRAQIEAEIEDERLKDRALQALEEEHQAVLAEIRDRALLDGRDFSEQDEDGFAREIARIQDLAAARIDAIRAAYGQEIELHREAQAEIVAIQAEALERIQQIQSERLQSYARDTADIFGNVADILSDTLGEQNDAVRAFLVLQRGFAVAELGIAAAQGIAKAISVGFPQNLPIIAAVTGQVAQATALLTNARGFQGGGHTGFAARDDAVAGVVHANEFVYDAPSVRRIGVDRLEWLRRNPDAIKRLRGYQAGGFVASTPILADNSFIAPPALRTGPSIDARAIFNGPIDASVMPDIAAMLDRQKADILAAVPGVAAQDVARGGGVLSGAIEGAYGTARQGV